MKKEIYALIFPLFLLASCHSAHYANRPSYPGKQLSVEADMLQSMEVSIASKNKRKSEAKPRTNNGSNERFVTYEVMLNLVAHRPDSFVNDLYEITEIHGGYVLETSPNWAVVRVKSEGLRLALDQMISLGRLRYEEITGEDVTDAYLDLGIRLENARKARKRYLELLDQVKNIQEGLMLERELERLNREIDLLAGKKAHLEHEISYATVRIMYREPGKPGLLSYMGIGVYKATRWLFIRDGAQKKS